MNPRFQAFCFLLLATAVPILAADGVLELSQECAEVGCFPGDTAGFPITITASAGGSSFILTSDLSVSADQTAIDVQREGVSIDLNKFTLAGPNFYCSGPVPSVTCDPPFPGSGNGIATSFSSVTVRSGVIRGMGRMGIDCSRNCRVEDVDLRNNAAGGIHGTDGVIKNSSSFANWGPGIFMFAGGLIADNTVWANSDVGIDGSLSLIRGNDVSQNGSHGIDGGRLVSGNISVDNGQFGSGWGLVGHGGTAYVGNSFGLNASGPVGPSGAYPIGPNGCGSGVACP